MDCNQARELMNSYIDGVLAEADIVAFEEHISCCENCHEEYDMLKKVSTDLSKTVAPLPDGFAERVHCALVNEKLSSEKKQKAVFKFYRLASGLAAALVIAAVGKFGIYDTYKKVSNEAIQMGTQPVAEKPLVPSTPVVANDVVPETEPKTAETPVVARYAEPTNKAMAPVQVESIPAPTEPRTEDSENGIAVASETPMIAAPMSVENSKDYALSSRIVEEETLEKVATDDVSSSGGSANAEVPVTDVEPVDSVSTEDAVITTEPIPAVAELNSNDEETMIAVKEFLLSLVEESAVVYEENVIKITVPAENYDTVVRCIGESKYIKSVGHGVPLDGVGIIIIK